MPIWAVTLRNIASAPAKATQVCLFTASSVARDRPGQSGLIEPGESWQLVLDQTAMLTSEPLLGAAWARAGSGAWYARCVDGRGKRFRAEPSESDVLAAFAMTVPATAHAGRCWSSRVS